MYAMLRVLPSCLRFGNYRKKSIQLFKQLKLKQMKKIIIICIATLAIFSCKKETKNTETSNTVSSAYFADENPSTDWEPRIKMYIDDMNGVGLGEYDTTSLDSTIFYMEAAVNYEYANFQTQLDTVFEKTDTTHFTITFNSNNVIITDVKDVYNNLIEHVKNEYNSITSANKTLKAVNIGIFKNTSGTEATLEVNVILGKGAALNYEVGAKTISGDRYWDLDGGFCDGSDGRGAHHQLIVLGNYNMNLGQIAVPFGKRFYIIELPDEFTAFPDNTYNSSNPHASAGGIYPSDVYGYITNIGSKGPCIPENVANWYLSRIPSVVDKFRTSGQTFVNLTTRGERISSTVAYYAHDYIISYGKIQITNDPSLSM